MSADRSQAVETTPKSCPFCGGEAYLREQYYGGTWKVCCDNYGCTVYPSITTRTEAEAIAGWNTRTPDQTALTRATIAFALALTIIMPVLWLALILIVEAVIQ